MNTVAPGNQPRDVIWSAKLDTKEDPVIVVVGSNDADGNQNVLVIWKMFAFLSRYKDALRVIPLISYQAVPESDYKRQLSSLSFPRQ